MVANIENWKPLKYGVDDYFSFEGDYADIVASWGYERLAFETHGDYQGDYFYLLRDGDEFGFLNVGYGSCSGCDALQACEKKDDVESLRSGLHSSIHWEDDAAKMVEYLLAHDWPGDYCGESEEIRDFIARSITLLGKLPMTETAKTLLANPECPAEILADAFEDYDQSRIARALRDANLAEGTLKRLRAAC